MCLYSTKEVLKLIGISERTFYRRISKLKKQKKFKKTSEGIFYTPEEVTTICKKLGLKVTLPNAV